MLPHPDDTIAAPATAAGPGGRAIIRISGPQTLELLQTVLGGTTPAWNRFSPALVSLEGVHSPLPVEVYAKQCPRTYTGQDTAEIHLISSPPLIEAVMTKLLNTGARSAQPGEFTMRAFLSGKKDLTQAEAVIAVIEAGSEDELKRALSQLAGGMKQPLQYMREDLLSLLADIEAGLDFSEEDIEFVGKRDILLRLSTAIAKLTNLRRQLEDRGVSDRPFRVALVGRPNAGKSSLFNALAGLPAAIVSPIAGTTRDYLTRRVPLGKDTSIELIDTAGWQSAENSIEEQAQQLTRSQSESADLLLWCIEKSKAAEETSELRTEVEILKIATKCDRGDGPPKMHATSAKSGLGIGSLRKLLQEKATQASKPALAPSLSRCRHHIDAAISHLRQAHHVMLFDEPAELLALELRLALEGIGEMVGAVYTDDLLDRIFSRFCIGK